MLYCNKISCDISNCAGISNCSTVGINTCSAASHIYEIFINRRTILVSCYPIRCKAAGVGIVGYYGFGWVSRLFKLKTFSVICPFVIICGCSGCVFMPVFRGFILKIIFYTIKYIYFPYFIAVLQAYFIILWRCFYCRDFLVIYIRLKLVR